MRKYIIFWVILLSFAFGTLAFAEQIDSYDVDIKINPDASINVSEQIQYDFGDLERHGIFRYLPIKYKARGGNFKLRISDISITDETGSTYNYVVTYPGDRIQFKIGDADILITGKHTYVINYTIKRAINYFADHDELYWNVTGDEWPVPILKSSASIILPQEFPTSKLQATCYRGTYGSTALCTSQALDTMGVAFSQDLLNSNEGLTVVFGWPKGIVNQPTVVETFLETLKDNWIMFVPLLVLIWLFLHWYTRGRDPEGRKTIIAEFDAPDKLTPFEIGMLMDEKADNKDISAELIYLATLGYLKISKEKGDYKFIKLKDENDLTNEFDKKLMADIFGGKTEVDLSDMDEVFYKNLNELKTQIYQATTDKGYFRSRPDKVRLTYYTIAVVLAVIGFSIAGIWGWLGIVSFIISAVIVAIFASFMPARTLKGVLAKEHTLGLKEYLVVAEKARLEFHNAPEKNPELFEKLLPFAMALGVEKKWAKQFADIYNTKPDWYSDSGTSTFNAMSLINSLSSFRSEANSTFVSMPASSGRGSTSWSGGSGFSGGFSGGGGGGGGGGSW
ncbi:MAG: hypothetical protein A2Y82_05370 [Candidatus Buchananbacteria bacterium RBG_13_36_9]|uniref:DUF2207 domain-containing protein n=1 Tax=Candidatus Buchananbacteria bacterium RBG_13_36_9 TaxID=1797530 RepID=A0A1G1XR90_9BACT|nr:MAG: hypothetical protein A2Y82_05370 [Candidatus Buchananbacteria bacterium RBG_13_36_9]